MSKLLIWFVSLLWFDPSDFGYRVFPEVIQFLDFLEVCLVFWVERDRDLGDQDLMLMWPDVCPCRRKVSCEQELRFRGLNPVCRLFGAK